MNSYLISSTKKSSGKTIFALGLLRLLKRLGYYPSPFKKGPDYIDAIWLTRASGRPCRNLDFNTMSSGFLCSYFRKYCDFRTFPDTPGAFRLRTTFQTFPDTSTPA